MGVRGLLKYLRTHREARSPSTSLRSVASDIATKSGKRTVLVCDFMAVVYWLMELFHDAMVKTQQYSKYSAIYGGDYNEYTKTILSFVKALRYIGLEPIFFVDGPRGASELDFRMKKNTWKERQRELLKTFEKYAEICKYKDPDVRLDKWSLYCLLPGQFIQALQSIDVEIVICIGEADYVMAEYTRDHHDNVCGILTNDSDMTMMLGCSIIHCKFFDRKNALKLGTPTINEEPDDIYCEMIEPQKLAYSLRIDERCLPALSILCGNDFTKSLNIDIMINEKLGLTYPFIESAARWISHHGDDCISPDLFLQIPAIKDAAINNELYPDAVRHTYGFYCSASVELDTSRSPISEHIIDEVIRGQLNPKFLSIIICGIFWRINVVQLEDDGKCIHSHLLAIRRLMYKLVCVNEVMEYGQSLVKSMIFGEKVAIPLCEENLLGRLRQLSFEQRMLVIFNVFTKATHAGLSPELLETSIVLSPSINLDICAVLSCTCLLYAISHDIVPKEYIFPLILSCFCCSLQEKSPKLAARPGPKGVTIASRFMSILQHTIWLASLLGLGQELPLPSAIFQPFVYIPLHITVFKINQKEKFYGEDAEAKEFYHNLSSNEVAKDFMHCICDNHAADNFRAVIIQYMATKDQLQDYFKRKKKKADSNSKKSKSSRKQKRK